MRRFLARRVFLLLFPGILLPTHASAEDVDEIFESPIRGHKIQYSSRSLCGVTSAYIVLSEFGIELPYESILHELEPSVYGNTMAQLHTLLTNNGLSVMPVKTNGETLYGRLRRENAVGIVNLFDHWVVVREASGKSFQIVDFPKKYYMPFVEIDPLWNGEALIVSSAATVDDHPIRRLPMAGALVLVLTSAAFLIAALRRKRAH